MEKIKKALTQNKIIPLILAQAVLVTGLVYPAPADRLSYSLRAPLFSQHKRPQRELVSMLLTSEGLNTKAVFKDIKKLESRIKALSRKKLTEGVRERRGLIKFGAKENPVEIDIGRDITDFSALVSLTEPRKKRYHLRALVNPYDRSSFILMFFSDKSVALRFQTGEWVYFERKEYLYIHHPEIDTLSLRNFKDHLWETYFDDKARREDYIFSQDKYEERGLGITSIIYQVGCGPITFTCPTEIGKKWREVALPRVRRIGLANKAGLWPSALVEVNPSQDATQQEVLFWKKGANKYNYVFFLPLSNGALIYTGDGLQKKIKHTGKGFKTKINMADELILNTFIDSIYWHGRVKWQKKKLGEQREGDNQEAHAHFNIGLPEQGGAVFQTHRLQDIIVLSPEGRSEGPSWYPVRILKDEKGTIIEILWLDKWEFGMFVKGNGVTQIGSKTLILLKGRYFYLPFIAELLREKGLITKEFLERIGRPGHTKKSTARYELTESDERDIYDFSKEKLVKVPVIAIRALDASSPIDIRDSFNNPGRRSL